MAIRYDWLRTLRFGVVQATVCLIVFVAILVVWGVRDERRTLPLVMTAFGVIVVEYKLWRVLNAFDQTHEVATPEVTTIFGLFTGIPLFAAANALIGLGR